MTDRANAAPADTAETADAAGAVARRLVAEHQSGAPFRPVAAAHGIADLAAAYQAQAAFVRLLRAARAPAAAAVAGYKIGLTSARMQAMCGIDTPIAGVVLAERVHQSGAVLEARRYGRLGLEFEIGVRLARDLPAAQAPFDRHGVAAAVGAVFPAIELVDDRRADYKTLEVLSLVADNSWNAGIVVGAPQATWPALDACEGVVAADGVELDRGFGRDALGHPFVPLAWLANHLAAAGGALCAGDIVMTGSIVPTQFPTRTTRYRYTLAGLGAVEAEVRV
jgi:2-keto-4-pentenoate hydratase